MLRSPKRWSPMRGSPIGPALAVAVAAMIAPQVGRAQSPAAPPEPAVAATPEPAAALAVAPEPAAATPPPPVKAPPVQAMAPPVEAVAPPAVAMAPPKPEAAPAAPSMAPGAAPALVEASDPMAILEAAKTIGTAEIATDGRGDPKIAGRIDASKYVILFHGCTNSADCRSIRFMVAWKAKEKLPLARINTYNDEKRFGKAYLDKDGDPTLELDVNLAGGVSRRNLEETCAQWKTSMAYFAKFLGR